MKLFPFARIGFVLIVFTFASVGAAPDGFAATPATASSKPHHHFHFRGFECVSYVRMITPILLRGNAWTWWNKADGLYTRGNEPKIGAVMVFRRTKVMPMGHVAVVRRVVGDREVWIEHANWARQGTRAAGKVSIGDRVIDVSPNNDWTEVRVWSVAANDFGRTNATYGFIYSPDYDQHTGIQWQQAENGGAPSNTDSDDVPEPTTVMGRRG